MKSKTNDEAISDATRIDAFLRDSVVREAFTALEQVYFREWQQTEDSALRDIVWAKARALNDIVAGLRAIVETGDAIRVKRDRAEKRDTSIPKR